VQHLSLFPEELRFLKVFEGYYSYVRGEIGTLGIRELPEE